ncbi:efflux RND transporter permease subunit, partial [Bacteroides sp.]
MKGNVFIKRPVMAISISVLILVIGLISLLTLPVEQYPDIAPPTVYVSAQYTGADA